MGPDDTAATPPFQNLHSEHLRFNLLHRRGIFLPPIEGPPRRLGPSYGDSVAILCDRNLHDPTTCGTYVYSLKLLLYFCNI